MLFRSSIEDLQFDDVPVVLIVSEPHELVDADPKESVAVTEMLYVPADE